MPRKKVKKPSTEPAKPVQEQKPVKQEPVKAPVKTEQKPEPKNEPASKQPDNRNLRPWTVDIRESLGDGFSEGALDSLLEKYDAEDKKVTRIYCKDRQAKVIRKFDKYKEIGLTVA